MIRRKRPDCKKIFVGGDGDDGGDDDENQVKVVIL
jgi:hypothetical protein